MFDATNDIGKRVVVSYDDGACAVIAESADGTALVDDLQQALHDAGITLTLTRERDDSTENALHHRDYVASKDTQRWQILVGTVRNKPGTAILTALP